MEQSDHIALTLTAAGVSIATAEGGSPQPIQTRKSLRRTWNQLPRLQRNLIIAGILCMCVIFFLFLPGDQIVSENAKSLAQVHGPANDLNDAAGSDDMGTSSKETLSEIRDKSEEMKENIPQAAAFVQKPIAEEAANLPEPPEYYQKSRGLDTVDDMARKMNIEEVNINNNNIEPAVIEEQELNVRSTIEAVMRDPKFMPGQDDQTVDEFVDSLDQTLVAQKRHFHGANNERQIAVVEAFRHSWNGYKKYAWGHDNLKPLSQTSHDWFGLGLTLVDSLDTMYIMGLEDDFLEARDWVSNHLSFDINRDVNLFEVTIRVLGGLLSAYHLSGDMMFLRKSIELGNRLLPCFLTSSGIPYSDVNLGSMYAHSPKWSPDSSTSEVTTIQLEFRDLSRCTGIPIYEKVVDIVNKKVHTLEKTDGLVPIFINANTGTFRNYATISLGARGDSYYEYLLKQWLQTGQKVNDALILDYMRAIDGVLTKLMRRTPREHHVYLGELISGRDFKPKMDHLTCYLPGTLLLGHTHGMPDSHLVLANDLLETCYQMYMKQPTQLAPEICYFALNNSEEHDIYVKSSDTHSLLRPEFIESLYYFYVLTGNRTYQEMGWTIFQAFEKHTKVSAGYTSIGNVKNIFNTRLRDMMESFWLGETLKYFYLLFSDDRKEIDLEKWVFNSEAHLVPIRTK